MDKWRNEYFKRWQNLLNQITKHQWAFIPLFSAPFPGWEWFCRTESAEMLAQVWHGFSSTTMTHVEFNWPPFPEWVRLDFAECRKIISAFTDSEPFSSSEEGAFVPLKSCPQDPSLSSRGCSGFPALPWRKSHCPEGKPQNGYTWHPRAARRNPSTVGDAGAAPVTIIRTHPPRLACWEEKRTCQSLCCWRWWLAHVGLIQGRHSTVGPYLARG